MKNKKLTQAELHRILCYNPLSGNFMWRVTLSNRALVGSIAGGIHTINGLPCQSIRIHKCLYQAHRLAFLYMRDRWPYEIDHKDGNRLNNCWLNLRECTHSQNGANCGAYKNNKLGIKGVHRRGRKYRVKIKVRGKGIWLGTYDTPKAAAHAYKRAAKKHFGEFARWN